MESIIESRVQSMVQSRVQSPGFVLSWQDRCSFIVGELQNSSSSHPQQSESIRFPVNYVTLCDNKIGV